MLLYNARAFDTHPGVARLDRPVPHGGVLLPSHFVESLGVIIVIKNGARVRRVDAVSGAGVARQTLHMFQSVLGKYFEEWRPLPVETI